MKMINPMNVIDSSRIQSFHVWLVIWLFLIIMFDGYDVVVYGAIIPSLTAEWGISGLTAGAIGSYTVLGTAVGGFLFGMLADKVGRKKIIVFTVILFSVFSTLSGFATGPIMFTIFRVLAGLGLGGVMPNVIALATEYAPKHIRTTLVSFIFCGYSIGAILASLTSRSLLPEVGWEPVLWLGGIPLLFIPFIIKDIPESVDFLLRKGKDAEARAVLSKIDSTLTGDFKLVTPALKKEGIAIFKLFEDKRAFSTLMFWLSCFSAFVLIYSMNTWLPSLMMEAGYDLSSSLMFTAVMQVGAILGTVIFGPLVDRLGFKKVLVPLFFGGAISLSFIGLTTSMFIAFVLIAIIGAASVGVQNLFNAVVSQYYPAEMRATAIGSTMAVGRIGGIVAPTFIGVLLSMGLQPQFNFTAIASAAVLGAFALLFVQVKHGETKKATEHESSENIA
ncbi:MFS transporter [Oceanobacillus rekensis]|uniref:MFS transporter n=1 Tax=Oceanobacillus rekensis TaxID=937927 RepID=UPI000B443F3B|nr:aromatic acid/H+ symport family MFS transporter [Oceanobacillus rekensis]